MPPTTGGRVQLSRPVGPGGRHGPSAVRQHYVGRNESGAPSSYSSPRPAPGPRVGDPSPVPSPSPLAGGWTVPRPPPRTAVRIGLVLDVGAQAPAFGRELALGATLAAEAVAGRGGVLLPDGARRPLELLVY